MLRCSSCGSLNYQTTLFVFSTGVEKMVDAAIAAVFMKKYWIPAQVGFCVSSLLHCA